MSPTVPSDNIAPVAPGRLGIGSPRIPADLEVPPTRTFTRHLDAARRDVRVLAAKTGRVLELDSDDGGFFVRDEMSLCVIAAGLTAEEAVANAEVAL